MNIKEQVIETIAEVLGVTSETITPELASDGHSLVIDGGVTI